ncbi:MAG: hypothetical protein ABI977_12940 [Acidobacteriota bacterium]
MPKLQNTQNLTEQSGKKRLSLQRVDKFANFITAAMEQKKLSSYEIERRAGEIGMSIDHSTVWRVASGKTPEVSSATLTALSAVLNIPLRQLRDVLEGELPVGSEAETVEVVLPFENIQRLRAEAAAHHRTLEEEAAAILAAYLGSDVNISEAKLGDARRRTKAKLRAVK